MSIRQDAINRTATSLFETCARNESISLDQLQEGIARGELVITKNKNHRFEKIIAIGKNVSTKINANIGSSKDLPELQSELQKLCVAIKAGADTVMDLSMGGDLDEVRRGILAQCPVPLGTVPIYQAVAETVEQQKRAIVDVEVDHIFNTIAKQAEDGVDFMTIHCGITKNTLERMNSQQRLMGVVSRGGSFTIEWMTYHNKENPLYEHYDELLAILKEYEVTLSLGDGIRPGCLVDATDRNQVQELIHLGE